MRSRNVMLTLVLLVGVFLFAIYKKRQEPLPVEAFHRTPDRLLYYAFARCRMQCLTISEADIQFMMQKGVVIVNRSYRMSRPCPVYAVQVRVRGQYLRVLFEQCRNATYVLNCYNLEQDSTCNCTTDYQPKQN